MKSFKSLVKAISPFTNSKGKKNNRKKNRNHNDESDIDDDNDEYDDDNDDEDEDDNDHTKYKKKSSSNSKQLHGKYKKQSHSPSSSSNGYGKRNMITINKNNKRDKYINNNINNNNNNINDSNDNKNNNDNDTDGNDIYGTYDWNIKGYRSSDIKYAVKLLYQEYNPQKIDTIDFIYEQWKGEDTLFLQNLCKRYKIKEKQMQSYLDDALLRDRRKSQTSSLSPFKNDSSPVRFSIKENRQSIVKEKFNNDNNNNNDNNMNNNNNDNNMNNNMNYNNNNNQNQPPSRVPPPPPPPPPTSSLANLFPTAIAEHLVKYCNMLKHGVPEQAVILAMKSGNISTQEQDIVMKSLMNYNPKPEKKLSLSINENSNRSTAFKLPPPAIHNDNDEKKPIIKINDYSKEISKSQSTSSTNDSIKIVEQLKNDDYSRAPKVIEKEVIVEKIVYRENEEKLQELRKELEEARKLYTTFEKLYQDESEKRHAIEEMKPKVIEKEVIVEKPVVVEKIIYLENDHKIQALQHELAETKRLYLEESDRRAAINDEKMNLLKKELEDTRKHMLDASKDSKQVIELLMKHGDLAIKGALSINAKNRNPNNDKINSVLELQMHEMKEELARTQADKAEIMKLLEVIAFSPVDTKMILDSYLTKYSHLSGILDPSTYQKQLDATFGSKQFQELHKRFYSEKRNMTNDASICVDQTQNDSSVFSSPGSYVQVDNDSNISSNRNLNSEMNYDTLDIVNSPIQPDTLKEVILRDQYDLSKTYIKHGTIQAKASQKLTRNNIALEAIEMKQLLTEISKKVKKDLDSSSSLNDWVEHIDPKTRRKYYYSKSRKKSQWNIPLEYSLSKTSSRPSTPLGGRSNSPRHSSPSDGNFRQRYQSQIEQPLPPPKKWMKAIDSTSGRVYYYCKETKESCWKKPDDYLEEN